MQLPRDQAYKVARWADFLLAVGEGKLPVKNVGDPDHGCIRIPRELLLSGGDDCDVTDLIDYVHADMPEKPTLEYYPDKALLTPYNDDVTSLNGAVLDRLPGRVFELKSADSVARESGNNDAIIYPIEFLNSLSFSGVPQHCLRLKVGRLRRHVASQPPPRTRSVQWYSPHHYAHPQQVLARHHPHGRFQGHQCRHPPHLAFPDGLPTPVQTPPSSVSVMGSCTLPSPVAGSHQMTAMGFVA